MCHTLTTNQTAKVLTSFIFQLSKSNTYESFYYRALIMLDVHAHLSEKEVIGYLGGFFFDSKITNQKYIIIQSAVPCESIIDDPNERKRNVDLCPESADRAHT
jgi:hypothetical protein